MLSFSRIAFLSALTVTAANAVMDCESHSPCQTVICEVFDDACPEENMPICEQLEASPWFYCHAEDELDNCETRGCGTGTECHQGINTVYCTCDNVVILAGEPCGGEAEEAEYTCTSLACHESSTCKTDGQSEFCLCEDGSVLANAHQPCPSHPQDSENDELFDCAICGGDKDCVEEDHANLEAGCYCDDLLVDPFYTCYYREEVDIPDCEGYCPVAMGSICFIEHGVPVCRCTDGDKVGQDDDCNEDRSNAYTPSEDGCEIEVCGVGAECRHHQVDGYTCTCGQEKTLIAHYQDCD